MFTQRTSRAPRFLLLAALPVAGLATVTACGNEKAPGSVKVGGAPVTGVHWTVRSMTVDGTTTKAPSGTYLEFVSDRRVRGNYGCNRFDAKATVTDGGVALGRSNTTKMYCEDKKQRAFEKSLARALADENTVKTSGDDHGRLTLTGPDGATISLVKQRDARLVGTKWTVTGLGADDGVQPLPKAAEGRARLVFAKEGTVSARLGCNSGDAKATVGDGHITFGPLTSTKMGCVGEASDVEQTMRSVLKGRTSYDIQGDTLTVKATDGTAITLTAGT
ncbi:META domain-containing protein [Streptomyces sp. NPDC046716]|uniref:META domain-containing protein n=1 Tax=Streptomyces sp. NPDC046716 TaxID=3157093 RepID=UPI0033C8F194